MGIPKRIGEASSTQPYFLFAIAEALFPTIFAATVPHCMRVICPKAHQTAIVPKLRGIVLLVRYRRGLKYITNQPSPPRNMVDC